MFDIGWSEMAIIMLLALIIIGPKDLPRVARTIGQWVRKGRMLAREFQSSLEEMAKEAELDDVKKEIEKVGRTDLKKTVEKTIDPRGDLKKAFDTTNGSSASGEDTVGKTLNGSAAEQTRTKPAEPSTPAPARAETTAKSGQKTSGAPKEEGTTPSAGNASTKTPAKAAKPSSSSGDKAPATKARAPKKPAAPKARAARKPASSAERSGSTKRSGGDGPKTEGGNGSAAMAAKSS